ncbi:MAG TPA: EAL domain-containing protein [Steroidobacteraceae bacterium]|nr:EAL domain-containing protein [Steroidobacteraceae bacterium]
MKRTALSSRMARRIAVALVVCSILPLVLFASLLRPAHSTALALGIAALCGGLCAIIATVYLERLYLPALRAARAGVDALHQRQAVALEACGEDEPRALIEALSTCSAEIEEQFRILQTLHEVDHLLLGSAPLEQVLEAMLSRVRALTHGHCAGITLQDGDAPGRGCVYVTAEGLDDLPVSRVALDRGILATLAAEAHGLTIARCEEARHSFLTPLKHTGAEVFWVWPVIVLGRVEAILAVGFKEAPPADARISRCGGEFAARLGAVLSRSEREAQLYRQAHYDPLTALPNRLLFREHLAQELAAASPGALLYIDLDYFKRVNDGFGHLAGDQLLAVVALRLRAAVKEGDLVARLGGDEFAVVLRKVVDAGAAAAVAERITESLRQPVTIGSTDHAISASIGITLFPEDGVSPDELVRNADNAMYRAKDLGRGRFAFVEREPAGPAAAATIAASGLQRALRKREFSLFYQPQFAVSDGALTGVEALLRWHTPTDGTRQPDEFVPAAEESGLIVDIGGWVLDAACAQLAVWRDRGSMPPRVAVNVCAPQLADPDFARIVRAALDKHGLSPESLELELAASALADPEAGAALARLVQSGARLVLDDFGKACPLTYLRRHPISVVKIDRELVAQLPHDAESAAIIETSIMMAHALGKRVVAQGIERIEQLDFLREHRCDFAQGFYLARPLSAAAMTELLGARGAQAVSGSVREAG